MLLFQAVAKKTRKQKIIADLKRQVLVAEAIPQTIQTQTLYLYPLQLVRKDLTKTFVLCILAISFEIALYFILERNLTLPFLK